MWFALLPRRVSFGLAGRLVGVAVVEAHWAHRFVVLVGREVVDDGTARAAYPDPMRRVDTRIRLV